MYDHTRQYRCTIIRGKSQSDMDNLLPLYAQIIDSICPCDEADFKVAFDDAIRPALKAKERTNNEPTQKTFDNHRTENAKQLFGMYYTADDGKVYASERTMKFIEDGDTPAFFKDICYKMQFPNGSQKYQTVSARINNEINIRQFPFLLKVMLLAKNSNNTTLSKKEIGYYVLNSLDVLQGKANPLEVCDAILSDRKNHIEHDIRTPGKKSSYDWQHINEQINLLEHANLVIIDGYKVSVNPNEMDTIQIFAERYSDKPEFDVYSYDLSTVNKRNQFYFDWHEYFSKLSDRAGEFETTADALGAPTMPALAPLVDTVEAETETQSTVEIGDEGERYVYEYEKQRVTAFNFRLAGKVIHLSKTRGLGYDIQSVVAQEGETAEFVKYIEVKATKRVTAPNIDDNSWIDTLNITRNEWVASQQHKDSYSIFRVYFVRGSVIMFVLTNIAQKCDDGLLKAVPTTYRIDFGSNAVDEVISPSGGATSNV